MNPNHKNWPTETLAAHADGELNAHDRAEVDAWLLTHPEARQELAAQKLLARKNQAFWNKVAAPQPSEAQWDSVFGNICAAVQTAQPNYRTKKATPWRNWALAGTGLAAAALLAVNFMGNSRPSPQSGGNNDAVLIAEEPWAVAATDDVNIISIQGDDGWIVVIGVPPLPGVMEMTTVGDVKLEAIVSDADGQPVKPGALPGDLKKGIYINPADKTTPVP
jgi:hypothetical protein